MIFLLSLNSFFLSSFIIIFSPLIVVITIIHSSFIECKLLILFQMSSISNVRTMLLLQQFCKPLLSHLVTLLCWGTHLLDPVSFQEKTNGSAFFKIP